MKKIYGLAEIIKVDVPEALSETNTEKDRMNVQLTIRYRSDAIGADVVSDDEFAGKVDDDLLDFAKTEASRSDYTYLWDTTKTTENALKLGESKILKMYQDKLEGKVLPFTTWIFTTDELLEGTKYVDADNKPYHSVHNDSRGYTSFSNTYLLKYEDKDSIFGAMQSRLLRDLSDSTLRVGRTDDEHKEWKKRQRKSDD